MNITKIEHVSFDVWNTLITANPEFASLRTKLIALMLNLDQDFVKRAYTQVKKFVDTAAETDGSAFSTEHVYKLLFAACGVHVCPGQARELRQGVEQLFRDYPPMIRTDIADLMDWLCLRGITTSIGSNSNFISGDVMHPLLQKALGHRFDFGVYSDLIEVGKPSPKFFERVYMTVAADRFPETAHFGVFNAESILHVGDNPICDIEGALNAGMRASYISSPAETAKKVMERVVEINDR